MMVQEIRSHESQYLEWNLSHILIHWHHHLYGVSIMIHELQQLLEYMPIISRKIEDVRICIKKGYPKHSTLSPKPLLLVKKKTS